MMLQKFVTVFSYLLFFLMPWLLTNSGRPQPVDIPIVILFFTFLILRLPGLPYYYRNSHILRVFFLFSTYIILLLMINYIISSQEETLYLILQNLYSIILLVLFLSLLIYFSEHFGFETCYQVLLKLIACSTIIPLIYFPKSGLSFLRVSLSFNNQNQLGFFCLVNVSIVFYLTLLAKEKGVQLKKYLTLYILNINLFFIFLSASRASYPTILLYVLNYPLLFTVQFSRYVRILLICIVGGLSIFLLGFLSYKLLSYTMVVRAANSIPLWKDFYYRALYGMDEIFSNNWYYLFGKGAARRSGFYALEFHNNFIAIFYMIGLFGILLYSYMNLMIFKKLLQRGFYYIFPFFCYVFFSMMHYTYRTRMNWLILAVMIFAISQSKFKESNQRAALNDERLENG